MMRAFLLFGKRTLFPIVFLFCYYKQLLAQTNNSDHTTYFQSLNISKLEEYDYIIIYPLHHHFPTDRTWIDGFINKEQAWKEILIVAIIQEHKQLNALNKYALNRKNLVIDSTYSFQNQSFYNYMPVIYSIKNKLLKEEAVLNWEHSYHWWNRLYRKYRK